MTTAAAATPTQPAAVAPELAGAQAATPELVEVTLGDKALKLDKDAAAAIKAFQESVQKSGEATAQEVAQLKAQLAGMTKPAPTNSQPAEPDLENLLFTDPKKAIQLIQAQVLETVNSAMAQTNAQAEFWREFYAKNDDLKDHDWLVRAVMQREYGTYKTMKVADVLEKLSETVKKDILKLGGKGGKGGTGAEIEGGTETNKRPSKGTEVSEPSQPTTTLTGVMKARAARRAAAARGEKPAA